MGNLKGVSEEKMKSKVAGGIKVERMEQVSNQQTSPASVTLKIGRLQQQIGDMKKEVEALLVKKNMTTDKALLEKINKENLFLNTVI